MGRENWELKLSGGRAELSGLVCSLQDLLRQQPRGGRLARVSLSVKYWRLRTLMMTDNGYLFCFSAAAIHEALLQFAIPGFGGHPSSSSIPQLNCTC